MNELLTKAIAHWSHVAPIIRHPKNEKEFNALVSRLDELLDVVGDDEHHPLIGLVDMISLLIATYEEKHYQKPIEKGVAALKFLIKEQRLRQTDLPEIGSQGVVSEILNGKRVLNLRQIKLLAHRFNVDPLTFIDS